MDEKQLLADLRQKHGGLIYAHRTPDGEIVVVAPTHKPEVHDQLINQLRDPKFDDAKAMRAYVMRCCVHPEPAEAKAILEKWTGIADTLFRKLEELGSGEAVDLGND